MAADRLFLVADPGPAALRSARIGLGLLERLNVPAQRVDARTDPGRAQIAEILHHPVSVRLPTCQELVTRSLEEATPAVLLSPEGELGARVPELAEQLGQPDQS